LIDFGFSERRYEAEKLIFYKNTIIRLSMTKGTADYEYSIKACSQDYEKLLFITLYFLV